MRDAIIPAGGTIDAAFAARIGTPCRALAPFGPDGMPVLQIVTNALRESGAIRTIICAAPQEVQARITNVDLWIDASDNGALNIMRCLRAVEDSNAPVFICASDLPLITPGDVRTFAALCHTDSDLSAGYITADAYAKAFSLSPPSQFTPMRGAGNIMLAGIYAVRPRVLLANEARLAAVFSGRKSQLRLARLLGPRLLLAWLTRTLDLASVTHRVEHILRCRAQAFNINDAPSLACDMDTEDDYTYARTVHSARLVS